MVVYTNGSIGGIGIARRRCCLFQGKNRIRTKIQIASSCQSANVLSITLIIFHTSEFDFGVLIHIEIRGIAKSFVHAKNDMNSSIRIRCRILTDKRFPVIFVSLTVERQPTFSTSEIVVSVYEVNIARTIYSCLQIIGVRIVI